GDEPFFIDELLEPRIRLVNYTYSHLPKSWLLSYLSAFRKIWGRIDREWKIDVIFAHVVLPAGLGALLLSRRFRLPVILTEHWGPAASWLEQSWAPRKLMRSVLRNTYRRADYLTAVSESLANDIHDVFGATVRGKLDQPINCDVFYPEATQAASAPPRVLCVTRGNSDPRKGVSNL